LEAHQFFGEAIDTWLSAGHPEEAGRLIKVTASDSLKFGEIQTLLSWLESLPHEKRQQDLALSALYALCLMLTGQVDLAQTYLNQIGAQAPAREGQADRGPFLAVQAWLASTAGSAKTGELAEDALAVLDESAPFFRIMALLALGSHRAWHNDLPGSNEVFRQAYQLSQAIDYPFTSMGALANLAFNLLEMGELREAETLCRAAMRERTDSKGNPLSVLGIIYSPLAAICYEKGDFDQAKDFAHRAIDLSKRLFSAQILGGDAEVVLSRTAFACGEDEEALAILHATAKEALPIVQYKMAVAEAELHILAGHRSEAEASLKRMEALTLPHLPKAQKISRHLQARYLILTDDVPQALSMLDELIADDPAEEIRRRLMGLHLSRALAFQQQGQKPLAQNAFKKSLGLAADEGYRSLFLPCEGRQTLLLLQDGKNTAPAFVESILELVEVHQDQPAAELLPDPLTEQEQRVLHLLIAGKSNQDIAEALVVSVGTAKWHVHNILTKLNASNRVEAAARARALGLDHGPSSVQPAS
jgi:LuxR family maltose regulon positive regulatory protein